MKQFWMLFLVTVSLSGFASADLDVPGSEPGTTVVAATNGTEYVGTFWWPNPPDGNSQEYLFTYQNGTYTILYALPALEQDFAPDTQINSSGVFAGSYTFGLDREVGFASICSSYDCLNQMVYGDYFANEMTMYMVGGVEYQVFNDINAWSAGSGAVDEAGDIIGGFENTSQEICFDGAALACTGGSFAIHDGKVYLDYQVTIDDPNKGLSTVATVNQFSWDGTNFSLIPEPSSLLLMASGLLLAVWCGRRLI
jgi:hypothetical protein